METSTRDRSRGNSMQHVAVLDAPDNALLADRYELLRRMGHDADGQVFMARDHVTDRPVAITVLARGSAANPSIVARFQAEIPVAASLNHPNVVRIIDFGAHDDSLYVVRESVQGTTLADLVDTDGPLPSHRAARIAADVAAALDAAHPLGITHDELDQSHVIIATSGLVKVAGLDTVGGFVGRPPGDPQADLRALGALLRDSMADAEPVAPPPAPEQPVLDALFVDETALDTQPCPPGIDRLASIIDRLVGTDDTVAFSSAGAAEAELRSYRDDPAPVLPPPVPAHRPRPAPPTQEVAQVEEVTSSPLFLVTLAGLLLLMIGLAVYLSNAISGSSQDVAADAVDVPTVIGDTQSVAIERLESAGFLVEELVVENDEFDAGTVFAQDPAPRSSMAAGEVITISIAQPSATIVVPDVVDKTRSDAVDELAAAGFTVDVRRESSDVVELDRVVEQSLQPGTEVEQQADITVVVSTGPERALLPDLAGMPIAEASAQLEALGFLTLRIEYEPNRDIARDSVVRTEPAVDSQVELAAPITVFVSTADHDFVPAVVGLLFEDAIQVLEDRGFRPEIEAIDVEANSGRDGTVLAQGPESDALVPIGSTVRLQVAREKDDRSLLERWFDRDDRNGRDRGRGNDDDD